MVNDKPVGFAGLLLGVGVTALVVAVATSQKRKPTTTVKGWYDRGRL